MQTLSNYIIENSQHSTHLTLSHPVVEGVNNRDIDKALNLIKSFLQKRNIYILPTIEMVNVDKFNIFLVCAFTQDNKGCAFMWKRESTTDLYAVMFTSDFDKCYAALNAKEIVDWDCFVQLKGAPIVRVLQLVSEVMKGKIDMSTASLNTIIRDAQVWESIDGGSADDPIISALEKKKRSLYAKIRNWGQRGLDTSGVQVEYNDARNQLADARVSVKKNVTVKPVLDKDIERFEKRFNDEGMENIAPHIMPETLSTESKEKAVIHLKKLAEQNIVVNIKNFVLCAKLFQSNAPRAAIEKRIYNQLTLGL